MTNGAAVQLGRIQATVMELYNAVSRKSQEKTRVETTRVGESGKDAGACKTIIIKLVKLISIKGS
jgi:hypothetical protein